MLGQIAITGNQDALCERQARMRCVTIALASCLFTVLSGCALLISPATEPLAEPTHPTRIDSATLADDLRSVRVDFIGGREFDPTDPCSVDYRADADVDGDELVIGIYATQHPMTLPARMECDAMGHLRTIVIPLAEPFLGTRVRDLAGQVFLLAPPEGLVRVGGLPEGWELRLEESLVESPTGRWRRLWSPDPDPGQDDSWIEVIQAFDGPANVTGGELQRDVPVNGSPATYFLHEPTGEMVLVWTLGGDGVALVGNLRDFTEEEFLQLAESIEPAS